MSSTSVFGNIYAVLGRDTPFNCSGYPCFCKPKPPAGLPLKQGGGSWPVRPPSTAFQVYFYFVQFHYTNGVPDGGSVLNGWGAIIYSAAGASAFGWIWPSDGNLQTAAAGAGYGAGVVETAVNFFDGGAAGGTPVDTNGNPLQFSSLAEAETQIGGAFSNYYYGY